MHPFANDSSVPANIRAKFARVTHYVVRTYDKGEPSRINFTSEAQALEYQERHAPAIGHKFRDDVTHALASRTLTSLTVESI